MDTIKKYQNQIAAGIQLLICAAAVILAMKKELQGGKKEQGKAVRRAAKTAAKAANTAKQANPV